MSEDTLSSCCSKWGGWNFKIMSVLQLFRPTFTVAVWISRTGWRGNILWAQPYYLPLVLSATSLVVTTLVTPGWWYSDLLFMSSSDLSSVILTPSWTCLSRQDLKVLSTLKENVEVSLTLSGCLSCRCFEKAFLGLLVLMSLVCSFIRWYPLLPDSPKYLAEYLAVIPSSSHSLQVPLYTQPLLVWEPPPAPLSQRSQSSIRQPDRSVLTSWLLRDCRPVSIIFTSNSAQV